MSNTNDEILLKFFKYDRDYNWTRCLIPGCKFQISGHAQTTLLLHFTDHSNESGQYSDLNFRREVGECSEEYENPYFPSLDVVYIKQQPQNPVTLEYDEGPPSPTFYPLDSTSLSAHPVRPTQPQLSSTKNISHKVMLSAEKQRELELNLGLFMSQTRTNNEALKNFHFRQFLSLFRPDFSIPPIHETLEAPIDKAYWDTIDFIKLKLKHSKGFVLMVNALELTVKDVQEFWVVCISIGIIISSKFQVILLSLRKFENNIQQIINQTLNEYSLDANKIIKVLFDGFEGMDIKITKLPMSNHFKCEIQKQLLASLNNVLGMSSVYINVNTTITLMIESICSNNNALRRFNEISGNILNSKLVSHEKQLCLFLKHRNQLKEVLAECSKNDEISAYLSDHEWKILQQFVDLKKLIENHFKVFDGKNYLTIDYVIPKINELLKVLKKFKLLDKIPIDLIAEVERTFAYIMDPECDNFDPIYVKSTFLSPPLFESLNTKQLDFAKDIFEKLIDELKNQQSDGKGIATGVHGRSVKIDAKFVLQLYIDHVKTNYPSKNALGSHEFWNLYNEKYRLLFKLAIGLLSIPITATVPFDSFSANYDSNEEEDAFSMSNPFDFIQMTQNVSPVDKDTTNLEKNVVIKLNRYLLVPTEANSRKKRETVTKKLSKNNDLGKLNKRIKRKRSPTPDRHRESHSSSRRRSPTPDRHRESRNSSRRRSPTPDRHRESRNSSRRMSSSPFSFDTPVLMVYGLDQTTFTCEFIFNLFSCYGNVRKVNFIRKSQDTCMVQMEDRHQASNIDHYLNFAKVFDATLLFKPSDYLSIRARLETSFIMNNGTCSFLECRKNTDVFNLKLVYPSKTLKFSNLPTTFTKEQFNEVLTKHHGNGPIPSEIIINDEVDNEDGVVSGTIRFESKRDAATFIMIYNNLKIKSQVLKLLFV